MNSIDKTIFAFAFLIILMPFLGFPRNWEDKTLFVIGVLIIVILLWRTWRIHKAKMDEDFSEEEIDATRGNTPTDELPTFEEETKENKDPVEDLIGPAVSEDTNKDFVGMPEEKEESSEKLF